MMSGWLERNFGLVEAAFVFSLVVAFYIWQMRDLKRENERAKAREAAEQAEREKP